MTRTGLLAGACALLAVAMAGSPAASAMTPDAAPAGGSPPAFVLGPDGVLYSWRTGDSALESPPPTLAQLGGRLVNDLAFSGKGGRMVVLLASPFEAMARHKRHEGSLLVISIPAEPAPPRVLNEIAFEGEGRRVAVSGDGRWAYVLAIRAAADTALEPIWTRVYALDLDAGRVVSSAQLDRPPTAMALDPSGDRLYLACAGRIVSYSTHPLAQSWHYRSPGGNRGLYFRPQSAILFSVRLREVALFDPRVIEALKPEQRHKLDDNATAVVALPFAADSLLFSQDGLLAAVYGPGDSFAFLDPEAGKIIAPAADEAAPDAHREVRPFFFGAGPGDLIIGVFPDERVMTVHPPVVPVPVASATRPLVTSPEPKLLITEPPITAAESSVQAPVPIPTPSPVPTDEQVEAAPVLAGRLTGRVEAVRLIVVFGPGSIVREQARATADAGGSWRIPLPPPGTYRVVPLGEGSRPLRSEPNFHTVEVKGQGRADLDFKILGGV